MVYLRAVLLNTLCFTFALGYQCVDHDNKPVDWFAIYKLPKQRHDDNKLVEEGLAYMYITSKDVATQQNIWKLSQLSINSSSSMPGLTLSGLYKNQIESSHILYNDEPANGRTNFDKGHTKGVVLTDSKSGFWLVHSVPHFPPVSQYSYPQTGTHFGQSFLCISLSVQQLNIVGKQLRYNEPYIYSSYIADDLKEKLPNLNAVIENNTIMEAPWYNKETLQSLYDGISFTSFAKSGNFRKDLYEDWLSTELKEDLFVETWPNGPGRLRSNCSKIYKVYNIEDIQISEAKLTFKSTSDHSKWAISKSLNWICIGDINRSKHQALRGGGTVCLKDQNLWTIYNSSVAKFESCNN